MGTFNATLEILPRKTKLSALVDTGATFTKIPSHVLKTLGVRVEFQTKVESGDGRIVKRDVGYVRVKLNGKAAPVPVVFGARGERPLIGATTLEILGLIPHPRRKKLVESLHLEVVLIRPEP